MTMDLEYLSDHNSEKNTLFFMEYLNYISLYMTECVPSVAMQAIESNYKGIAFCFLISLCTSLLHKTTGNQFLKDIIICLISTISGAYLLLTSFDNGAWSIFLFVATAVCIICVIKPVPRLMGVLGLCAIYVVFKYVLVSICDRNS